jgi:hypothetical protein
MEASAPAIGAILMIIAEAKKFLEGELLFFDALRAKSHLANLFLRCQDMPEKFDGLIDFFRDNVIQAAKAESSPECLKEFFPEELESFSSRRRFFCLLRLKWISLAVGIDPRNYPHDDKQTSAFFKALFGVMESALVPLLQKAQGF